MRTFEHAFGISFFLLLVGCASLASLSSGQVGCPESAITITNDEMGFGTRTWTARCQGRTYYCSAHGGGNNSTAQVSCKESASGATTPPAPPVESGCKYDTQCKGDRVCRDGNCVDP